MEIIPQSPPKGQATKVLNHLKNVGSITSWEAFKRYHITRLSAVIYALKDAGYPIGTTIEYNDETKTHYARYAIKKEEN